MVWNPYYKEVVSVSPMCVRYRDTRFVREAIKRAEFGIFFFLGTADGWLRLYTRRHIR